MELKKISLADQVYDSIKNNIVSLKYNPGEKLPSENELAKIYGVSRVSIRSAIQKLATLGFITVKVGEGSFVNEKNFINLTKNVSDIIATESIIEHISEVRTNIEIHCLSLAMERSSKKDLETLIEISNNLIAIAKEGNIDLYLKENYNYHYNLCKLSKNELYEFIYSTIREPFMLSFRTNLETYVKNINQTLINSSKSHLYLSKLIVAKELENSIAYLDVLINFNEYSKFKKDLKFPDMDKISYLKYLD